MNINYLIYALIIVGIFTVYMALVHIFRPDRQRDRLKAASHRLEEEDEDAPPAFAVFCQNLLATVGIDIRNQKHLSLMLLQAGISSPYAVAYFLFFKRIVQPVLLIIGGFFFIRMITAMGLSTGDVLKSLVLSLIMIIAGMFGANLYVTNAKQHRQQKLLYSFPEALDLLLVCIESGLGLDAALSRVSTEMKKTHPEVASEIERTRVELTVLSDRSQALQNLADRTEIVPFKSLVASLIQTEKFGTSLVDTLRVLSEDQRVTRLLNAENRAARIPVLITIPLILCILPALIIVIVGPPIVRVSAQGGLFGSATPGE